MGRKLLTRVADVMHKDNLPICACQDSIRDVVHTINRGQLWLALVMQGQELQGLITDGDVIRAFDSGHDYKTLAAEQIMLTSPKLVRSDMRFAEAQDLMRAGKINAPAVKDASENVVGVLQIFDIQ